MRFVYKLLHNRPVKQDETSGERVDDVKLLGFFSTKEQCQEAISYYITQPGFQKYPDDFIIEKIEADIDEYNEEAGQFSKYVYFLSHEWYDGEYDYVSELGYYSTYCKAEKAEKQYREDPELAEHPNGFVIDAYEIDKLEWEEGFCSWEEMDEL